MPIQGSVFHPRWGTCGQRRAVCAAGTPGSGSKVTWRCAPDSASLFTDSMSERKLPSKEADSNGGPSGPCVMNIAQTTHPTQEQLEALGLGRLSDAEAAAVEMHVAECSHCARALEGIPADSFLAGLREARQSSGNTPVIASPSAEAPTATGFEGPRPEGDGPASSDR